MKSILFIPLVLLFSINIKAQQQLSLYFNSNESSLSEKSNFLLDSLSQFINKNTVNLISISGYTDSTGAENENKTLSEKRAASVAQYLISKGILKTKIETEGFGSSSPVGDNSTEQGKALNRRAEISVQIIQKKNANMPAPPPPAVEENKEDVLETPKLEVGSTLVLKNIKFEGGTAELLMESKPALESLLKTMNDNPTMEIEIGGHVCCADDMPLSIERAKAVYDYLAYKGIDKKRLKYVGYSRNKPIGNDSTEEGRKQNRRVEITILKE